MRKHSLRLMRKSPMCLPILISASPDDANHNPTAGISNESAMNVM